LHRHSCAESLAPSSQGVSYHKLCPSVGSIGYAHQLYPLIILNMSYVLWSCPSVGSIGYIHWLCPSVMSVGYVHRLCPSVMSIGYVHRLCPSVMSIAYVHRSCPSVIYLFDANYVVKYPQIASPSNFLSLIQMFFHALDTIST
jgi:hypothetical protein